MAVGEMRVPPCGGTLISPTAAEEAYDTAVASSAAVVGYDGTRQGLKRAPSSNNIIMTCR